MTRQATDALYLQRYYSYAVREPESGCLVWTRAKMNTGYGCTYFRGRATLAHIAVYTLVYGLPPAGHYVCHSCDNPSCIEPTHLFTGTAIDNMRDASEKGRLPGPRKLTESEVMYIISSKEMGITLARRFGVANTTISKIRLGKRWKHL